jgi:hypothetical protein
LGWRPFDLQQRGFEAGARPDAEHGDQQDQGLGGAAPGEVVQQVVGQLGDGEEDLDPVGVGQGLEQPGGRLGLVVGERRLGQGAQQSAGASVPAGEPVVVVAGDPVVLRTLVKGVDDGRLRRRQP